MKKIALAIVLLVVLGTTSVFAVGLGVQGGYAPGSSGVGGGAITFKLDKPWVFAINATFGNYTAVGVTADTWIKNPKLSGGLGYFYGLGLAGSFGTTSDWSSIFLGARAFLGLNFFVLKGQLEFYLMGAWQPGFWISVSGNDGQTGLALLSFPLNIGFRFWF